MRAWTLEGAKQDPVVQLRCIGLAKLVFFVLAIDAFGTGERGTGRALGEYHGEMVGATLWPAGIALAGLQVYENMRAVDYLQSRPEVDPERIGITGTSGGGNQSMYAGVIDERLKCVVPVCSVGTYLVYLGVACCMCEVTPTALSYTEEWGVLERVAPRALMVINATRDSIQFSVNEAKKSLARTRDVFCLYGATDHIRHTVIESGHDYNQPMREAMYGWMTRHLKDQGDGSPIPEPEIVTEEPEALRCYPGETRPDSFVTIPAFAAEHARHILRRQPVPDHPEQWQTDRMMMHGNLTRVLGSFPGKTPLQVNVEPTATAGMSLIEFAPEPGITVTANLISKTGRARGLAVLLYLGKGRAVSDTEQGRALIAGGWNLVTADLRATGASAPANDEIRHAPDHNSAEWSMWIGRPLLGQWTWDAVRLLDALSEQNGGADQVTVVIGLGPASLVASVWRLSMSESIVWQPSEVCRAMCRMHRTLTSALESWSPIFANRLETCVTLPRSWHRAGLSLPTHAPVTGGHSLRNRPAERTLTHTRHSISKTTLGRCASCRTQTGAPLLQHSVEKEFGHWHAFHPCRQRVSGSRESCP